MMIGEHIQLGCGLLKLGRPWATTAGTTRIPSDIEAQDFLEAAYYEEGVRFFDTAPSYGLSERRLGVFLKGLSDNERAGVKVATKIGEHWDDYRKEAVVDYSLDALRRSIDVSVERLGHVALLQLHRPLGGETLKSEDVDIALNYAEKEYGITNFGLSTGHHHIAEQVIEHYNRFKSLQVPYNQDSPRMKDAIKVAKEKGIQIIVNRPFVEGRRTARSISSAYEVAKAAFYFILKQDFRGVVLTGTTNPDHLAENSEAFGAAFGQLNS